jgi:opacity protein-like surface antigen
MPRVLFVAVCAVACAAAVLAPAATAKPLVKTCEASSADVVGGDVVGKLTATNVDPLQAQFATCKQAKKVMKRATELGVNAPRPVRSFYCRPTESEKNPARVSYVCTFRGADTATFIKLTFEVTYKE